MRTVLDIETTVQWLDNGRVDGSCFNEKNYLVSCGFKTIDDSDKETDGYVFFEHTDKALIDEDSPKIIQSILDKTTLLIGHNIKFDFTWLQQCGFKYEGLVFDTMVSEYLLLRGLKAPLSLAACCIRRGVQEKKKELIDEYWKQHIGYEAIPRKIVEEYGVGDVQSTWELYKVNEQLYSRDRNAVLKPTRDMMNELLLFLCETEQNGIYINTNALNAIERDYIREKQELLRQIDTTVRGLIGDTPFNLSSPEQLSCILYSRKVLDKHEWASIFNIGLDEKKKPLRRPRMSKQELMEKVRANTSVLYRTSASQCTECVGTGRISKYTKGGVIYKNLPRCSRCGGMGITYTNSTTVAGLTLRPRSIKDLTASGFSTDKETLEYFAELPGVSEDGRRLLKALVRLNAVETYLSSFIGGIRRNTRSNKLLHTSFNQCITATGRLSSNDPNFQNLPRSGTFPVRRAIRSRWKGGQIAEVDFSQLEFRVAADLSKCPVMLAEIVSGVDVHRFTSETLTKAGQPTSRQDAKPKTFRPLYGGTSGTPAEVAYNQAFMAKYTGLSKKHDEWLSTACFIHTIRLPTGREYVFPEATRQYSGYVTQSTQIKNYPVQGFATADIVPVACINLRNLFRKHAVKSLIINTVHDSLVVDVFPGEIEQVSELMVKACLDVVPEIKRRYDYDITVPLGVELKAGSNWLNMKVLIVKDMVNEYK